MTGPVNHRKTHFVVGVNGDGKQVIQEKHVGWLHRMVQSLKGMLGLQTDIQKVANFILKQDNNATTFGEALKNKLVEALSNYKNKNSNSKLGKENIKAAIKKLNPTQPSSVQPAKPPGSSSDSHSATQTPQVSVHPPQTHRPSSDLQRQGLSQKVRERGNQIANIGKSVRKLEDDTQEFTDSAMYAAATIAWKSGVITNSLMGILFPGIPETVSQVSISVPNDSTANPKIHVFTKNKGGDWKRRGGVLQGIISEIGFGSAIPGMDLKSFLKTTGITLSYNDNSGAVRTINITQE